VVVVGSAVVGVGCAVPDSDVFGAGAISVGLCDEACVRFRGGMGAIVVVWCVVLCCVVRVARSFLVTKCGRRESLRGVK
jgi:hypothetical protein